jgi:hypothetical protein
MTGPVTGPILGALGAAVAANAIPVYQRYKKEKKKKRYKEGKGSKATDDVLDQEYELSKIRGYPPDKRSKLIKLLTEPWRRPKGTWDERQKAVKGKPWILRSKGGKLDIDNSGQKIIQKLYNKGGKV